MLNLHQEQRKAEGGGKKGIWELEYAAALRNMSSAPKDTSQESMQLLLDRLRKHSDLNSVMDSLYRWELAAGYITREKLEENEHLSFYDVKLEIEFRIQINVARSKYSPISRSPQSLPVLHCALCRENIGRPGKEFLRIYELTLPKSGADYFLQLTPYPLFPYHFVLILSDPSPMRVDAVSMGHMMEFLSLAPGYTVCSNSDVEWAGASILTHHHFQVFKGLTLPAMTCGIRERISADDCIVDVLDYPLAAVRIHGFDGDKTMRLAAGVVSGWKSLAQERNTANLILSRENGGFSFHVFFRNPNYRIHETLTRFKKEGLGIIEAAGAGMLPLPSGPNGDALLAEIRSNGKNIMLGMLSGINPVRPMETLPDLVKQLLGGT